MLDDHARAAPHGARQPLVISAELHRALLAIGRREGASLYMTLLAATQALLHRYTGQEPPLGTVLLKLDAYKRLGSVASTAKIPTP